MAEMCTAPIFLAVAEALWRAPAEELRLNEQVPIRTDPEPLSSAKKPGTAGYHCDFVFQRRHFSATPRQTYFQTFSIFSKGGVQPGGACTMVIPGSHHRTMALAEQTDGSSAALEELRGHLGAVCTLERREECMKTFGIDPAAGVEIPAPEGALVVFCPHCMHSGSVNFGSVPRYVVVQSFQHYRDARLMRENLASKFYLKGFHRDTHAALANIAPELSSMLRGKHLWGEAMAEQLKAFKVDGFFLRRCVAIGLCGRCTAALMLGIVMTQPGCRVDTAGYFVWMELGSRWFRPTRWT